MQLDYMPKTTSATGTNKSRCQCVTVQLTRSAVTRAHLGRTRVLYAMQCPDVMNEPAANIETIQN